MASLLEQAFGKSSKDLDLYVDVLKVSKACTPAQLRKAYYQQALQFHPDKNDSHEAKLKFQAISWAYNYLKDPSNREEYDQDGIVPHDDQEDDNDDEDNEGMGAAKKSWKDYFDTIFGKLSTDDIDNFAMKYKMSDEEERDVLENYTKFKGNLIKMLEFVMLSEERDVPRWMEDYIRPAIASGKVENYDGAMKKAMTTIEKKLAGIEKKKQVDMVDADPDETETDDSDNIKPNYNQDFKPKASKKHAKINGKSTKSKPAKKSNNSKKKGGSSEQDLIAMIRNKNGRGNPLASIAARYGVSNIEKDPLDDASFAKIQSKMKKKK
jgi:DnaJ homolog subfamily C member 9